MNNCITNTKIFKIEKEKIATNSMRNIKLHQKQKLDITNNLNKEKSIEEKIEDLQHIIKNKDNIIKELTKNREIERLNMQNEYVKELQNVREELNNAIDLNVNLQEQFVTYLQNSIQTREMMRAVNRGFFNIHRYTSNILLNNINFIEEVGIRIESNYSLLNILGGGIIAITTAFGL
jgi:predicted RNase H-like nuclease (RuvC/YqgF family)